MMIGWDHAHNIWVVNELSSIIKLVFYAILAYWNFCMIKVVIYLLNRIRTPSSITLWNKGVDIEHVLYNFSFKWDEINTIASVPDMHNLYEIILNPPLESSHQSRKNYRLKKYFSRNLRKIRLGSFHNSEALRSTLNNSVEEYI